MDPSQFGKASPGQLVLVDGGELGFLPDPLPPLSFAMNGPLYELLAEAKEKLGEIRGLTAPEAVPNPSVLLRPLQREESLRSSSLEGTFASADELLQFELNPTAPRSAGEPNNHRLEVHNHDQALREGEQLLLQHGLTPWTIRSLHATLLKGVRGEDKAPGSFRPRQVYIGSDHRFVPPPPHLVEESIAALVAYWSHPTDSLPPLVRVMLFHYQFEAIHPFLDGNGRIGRLLLALMLARECGLERPWLYLSAFFERHKDEYVDALFKVSAHGDWNRWVGLCLRSVIAQAKETSAQLRELITLRKKWNDAIGRGVCKPRVLQLVDRLMEFPIIDTSSAMRLMGVSFNTARSDLDQLVKSGLLSVVSGPPPQLYANHEVIRIVHGRTGEPTPPTSP